MIICKEGKANDGLIWNLRAYKFQCECFRPSFSLVVLCRLLILSFCQPLIQQQPINKIKYLWEIEKTKNEVEIKKTCPQADC